MNLVLVLNVWFGTSIFHEINEWKNEINKSFLYTKQFLQDISHYPYRIHLIFHLYTNHTSIFQLLCLVFMHKSQFSCHKSYHLDNLYSALWPNDLFIGFIKHHRRIGGRLLCIFSRIYLLHHSHHLYIDIISKLNDPLRTYVIIGYLFFKSHQV